MKRSTHPRNSRRRFIESLEDRLAFDGGGIAHWDSVYGLTASFAPEGTVIGPYHNDINTLFNKFSTADWHDAVIRGLQTWASLTNANIGLVDDSGAPFGARALDRKELQFGDVRIGAVPMSENTVSISIPENEQVTGSWAGDILFNSNYSFNSVDDIFRASLHEAGHVFGLEHNPDPNSPMHAHGVSSSTTPTSDDIAALMALYGARGPDRNELQSPNDTISKATRIRFESDSGFDGSTPAIEYGDITTTNDADVYEVRPLLGYTGSVDIEVTSNGISQLQFRVEILDKNGIVQQSGATTTANGTIRLTIPSFTGDTKLYVRVTGSNSSATNLGAYAILQRFNDRLAIAESEIQRTIVQGHRLIASSPAQTNNIDLRTLFRNTLSLLNDDGGTDDTANKATTLKPVLQTAKETRYQVLGSIASAADVDFDSVKSYTPTDTTVPQTIRVEVESLDSIGLIPDLEISDKNGVLANVTTVANGHGIVIKESTGIAANQNFTIRIATHSNDANLSVGNYRLTVRFSQTARVLTEIASSSLNSQSNQSQFVLYVAQTQLMQLGLRSSTTDSNKPPVWVAIFDSNLKPIFSITEYAGETRTVDSILLQPGEYHIQLSVDPSLIIPNQDVSVALFGDRESDPLGPPVINPANSVPYSCPGTTTQYCYPDGTRTTNPTNVAPPVNPQPPPPTPLTRVPVDQWFWTGNASATNPFRANDVDNDGSVSPLDVLIIINRINSLGSGRIPVPYNEAYFYDVNNDGVIDPLDVLVVINYLNSRTV